MHTLLLSLLAVIPPAVVDKLPELKLPLDCPGPTSPKGVAAEGVPLTDDERAAVRKTLAAWAAENPGRIDRRVGAVDEPNASEPISVGLRIYGKVVVSGQTAMLVDWVRSEGPGGPDDFVDSAKWLVVLNKGAVVDAEGCSTYSSQKGERDGAIDASGKITQGQLYMVGQDGPNQILGKAKAPMQLTASGLICPADAKAGAATTYEDPKSKERLTLKTECPGRVSVQYLSGKPDQQPVSMVVTNHGKKALRAQFAPSPKLYVLEPSADGKTVKCTNPDKSVQKFERVAE